MSYFALAAVLILLIAISLILRLLSGSWCEKEGKTPRVRRLEKMATACWIILALVMLYLVAQVILLAANPALTK